MAKIDKMITVEQVDEILKAINSANDGVWFPITTVVACFGIVITLLLYIWNKSQKANEKRHDIQEVLTKDLIESKHTTDLILGELKIISQYHDDDIRELKSKANEKGIL